MYIFEIAYAVGAALLLYLLVRLFGKKKKPNDDYMSTVLNSPEYKVKGKFEF